MEIEISVFIKIQSPPDSCDVLQKFLPSLYWAINMLSLSALVKCCSVKQRIGGRLKDKDINISSVFFLRPLIFW
jgi:hypothetical protein